MRALLLAAGLLAARPAGAHPRTLGADLEESGTRSSPRDFQAEAARYRRKREADIRSIRLEIEPDLEKGSLRGRLVLSGAALAGGLRRLELDSVRLKIESVEDGRGKALDFEVLPDKVAVDFPKELAAGEAFELRIRYSGEPKMGLYFHQPDPRYPGEPLELWSQGEPDETRHWTPLYDYPNDRASLEMLVTAPDGLTAVSNGKLVSKTAGSAPGTTLWRWRQERSLSPYLITLAVGRFEERDAVAGRTTLRFYVPPDKAQDAERTFGRTGDMVEFYAKTLEEPYPWGDYAQLALYGFGGGMENAGATSLTDQVLLDEKARPDGDWAEDLISHELAHQWFGDLLTCKDWAHLWLNEGFASYFQALYRERWLGEDEFLYDMDRKARSFFSEAAEYERPVVTNSYSVPDAMFDAHTYDKGAWVLHMLRKELGEGPFWASLRLYVQRGKGGLVETEDLRRAVEDATGRPMQEFFDQWLYAPGHPRLELKFEWDAFAKTAKLRVSQKQAKPFQFKLPVEFEGTLHDDAETALVSKAEESFAWKLSSRPRSVRVDPAGGVLKELSLDFPEDMLERQLKKDASVRVRLDSARALRKAGGPEAEEALARCLAQDSFWGVRAECARLLAELGGPAARDALIGGLADANAKVRQASASALGHFVTDEKAYAALAAREQDASWNVRASVLGALGALRLEKARPLLESRLSEDSWNDKVRRGALAGLSALESADSLPILKDWAGPGHPASLRAAALTAYAHVASSQEGAGRPALDFISRVMDSEDEPAVLGGAVSALAALGEPDGAKALDRLAARDPRESLRRRAEQASADLREGKKDRVQELDKRLDDLSSELEKLRREVEEKKP